VNVWELICQYSADFSSSLSFFSSATEESKCAYTILHHPSQFSMLDVHARASMLLHFSSSPTAFDRVDEIRIFERGLTSQSTIFSYKQRRWPHQQQQHQHQQARQDRSLPPLPP
jgi:hypothetical protein